MAEERCRDLLSRLTAAAGWTVRRTVWWRSRSEYFTVDTPNGMCVAWGGSWRGLLESLLLAIPPAGSPRYGAYPWCDAPEWLRGAGSPEELELLAEVAS